MSLECEDVIEATPPKQIRRLKIKRKKTGAIPKHFWNEYVINPNYMFLRENKPITPNYSSYFNKPYIFYTIEEASKLPKDNLLDNYIHLVGIYRYSNENGSYVRDYSQQNIVIPINLKYVTNMPGEGEILSIYGCLEDGILVVKFYRRELKTVVEEYMQNLILIRRLTLS